MPFTDILDEAIVKRFAGDVAWTPSATLYVALSTTTPRHTKGSTPFWNFTEPSGNAYARVAVTNDTSHWETTTSEPGPGWIRVNTSSIIFPTPTGSWGTVTYFGLFSASTAGTLWCYGAFTVAKAIGSGDTPPTFAAKALKVKCA